MGGTAEVVTLKCRHCGSPDNNPADVPVLATLRDTLGMHAPALNRLSYVWLLSSAGFTTGQRILSAVPFFYWRVGYARASNRAGYPAPLLDVSAPLHPVVAKTGRAILQWAAFDPLTTSVRATTRSYQANQDDNERLHLEQAITYLQSAPVSTGEDGLSAVEINTLLARLQLRKSMLGGLLQNQRVAQFGQQSRLEDARIRGRNFEALRQFAEKTGTYFEPLRLAGNPDGFAILWFPAGASHPPAGTAAKPIWKLLNIRDAWTDPALVKWQGPSVQRALDDSGRLRPAGTAGSEPVKLIPLAVYSLDYPQMPLLLIDFRDKLHVQRHEMMQRTITELTGGILGLSHFANWYYYAGAFAYHTVWARRGTASNQAARLEAYTQFRMQLALDRELDPQLRQGLIERAGTLNVNPLDSDPAGDLAVAQAQYARLLKAAEGKELLRALDRGRRAELAAFGQSAQVSIWENSLHFLSLGTYTRRVSQDPENIARLERNRRISYQLEFLEAATANGTDPRVAYDGAQLDAAVDEVAGLLDGVKSPALRQRAHDMLARVQSLSKEPQQTVNASLPMVSDTLRR